jgi:hypothetical protein
VAVAVVTVAGEEGNNLVSSPNKAAKVTAKVTGKKNKSAAGKKTKRSRRAD